MNIDILSFLLYFIILIVNLNELINFLFLILINLFVDICFFSNTKHFNNYLIKKMNQFKIITLKNNDLSRQIENLKHKMQDS